MVKFDEKITNQRKNYFHKITLDLVKNNDIIVVEIENQDFNYKHIKHWLGTSLSKIVLTSTD